jgi:PAS domain S-box-containing protein
MKVPFPVLVAARWLLALVAPAAALGLTLLLQPLLYQAPSPPFIAATLVVAWLGGFGPGLLATVVSALALDYFFLPPIHDFTTGPGNVVWLLLFTTVAVATAWLVASRGRARARLASSEQQLRLVTDTAPQLIYYVDTGRRYRFANRPYAEHYGHTPRGLVGRRVAEVLGADRYTTIKRHLTEALAGRRVTFEVSHAGETGVRHFHVTYVPDLDTAGAVRGVVAVIDDITARKQGDDERVRLLALEQARRREAEAIAELGRLLTEGLDLDTVARRIAELAQAQLRATATSVFRVDPVSRDFVCLATAGEPNALPPGWVVTRGAGAVGRAVECGRPVASADVLHDPEIDMPPALREQIEQAHYRAVLAVPLRAKGRIVGAFAAGDELGRVFSVDEVRLAEALADHAAAALENAQLYAEAGERGREAELVSELARAVNASLDLGTVLGRVTAAAQELCRADRARIAVWDEDRQVMVFRYAVGSRAGDHAQARVTSGEGLAGEALATGRPVRSVELDGGPWPAPDPAARVRTGDGGAVLIAPILMGGAVEGLLHVDNRPARAFTDRDEAILMRLADHAAVALGNARLFAGEQAARGQAEARARRTRLLADVSRVLASALDYESTLGGVARLLVPVHADWCVIHLARHDGAVRPVGLAYADPAHARLATETLRRPPTGDWRDDVSATVQSIRAGRSVLVADTAAAGLDGFVADAGVRHLLLTLRPRSMLVAPLVARGRTLGSLTWLRITRAEPYTPEDVGLAEDVAGRAAVAIDSARLYRRAERARVEAENANQAKDEFLAVLSHELRTPLTSMLGWLRLLRSGHLDADKVAQALEVVERNTRTQAQLINDLLDVCRIITGKLELDLYPVELAPIVDQVAQSARRAAEAKGVAIELRVSAAPGPVLGDPVRLEQILTNLIVNAVKFTSAGGRVCVSLARADTEAVVTVTDDGIGIEPELLGHIFDRFRQADSTITRRHGGLGLGLAIARHLAELHGGSVSAESRGRGHGATFTLRVPLAASPSPETREDPAPATLAADGGHAALAGVRVLLVEDHPDTAELLRTVLGGHGAGVHVAGSLGEALATLAEREFDVLVSDIGMPDGTGYELVQHVRERARADGRPPVPTVAVTAFAGSEDRARALAAGFFDYAAKPIEPSALVETIARATGR